jgi:hypothetical protein
MELLANGEHSDNGIQTLCNERRTAPDAPMNLLLRFETASGPRTVIASSVPRQIASEISHVMRSAGQYAEFIDRFSPFSVEDRLFIKDIKQRTESGHGTTNVVDLETEKSQPARRAIR